MSARIQFSVIETVVKTYSIPVSDAEAKALEEADGFELEEAVAASDKPWEYVRHVYTSDIEMEGQGDAELVEP